MKLDKRKILGDAKQYFATKGYTSQSYSLAEECVSISQKWLDGYKDNYGGILDKEPKEMRKELKSYIKERVDYDRHNTTFIPSFVWMWIIQAVITWIVNRIIDNVLEQKEERYL